MKLSVCLFVILLTAAAVLGRNIDQGDDNVQQWRRVFNSESPQSHFTRVRAFCRTTSLPLPRPPTTITSAGEFGYIWFLIF